MIFSSLAFKLRTNCRKSFEVWNEGKFFQIGLSFFFPCQVPGNHPNLDVFKLNNVLFECVYVNLSKGPLKELACRYHLSFF